MISLISDSDVLQMFYALKNRTGSRTMIAYRSAINRFLTKINKPIQEISRIDAERYLAELDRGGFKQSYKKAQLKFLNTFFKYVEDQLRSASVNYISPIPNPRFYPFSLDESSSISEDNENLKDQYYTVEQLIELLDLAFQSNYEMYIQMMLMTMCGMRVSECVSIRKENFNLEERYLKTGLEENCRKSNRDGKHPLYFCFPKVVQDKMFDYLMYHEKKYGKEEIWLFPARHSYSNSKNFERFLNSLMVEFNTRSHKFRKAFETYQAFKSNNAPPHIVELLSNHRITSVVYKDYAKCSITERREYYDQYFPKEFQKILAFIQNQ